MLHLLRKQLSQPCPVCCAEKYKPCIPERPENTPEQMILPFEETPQICESEYLEFEIIDAVRRLRELKPDHMLVRVFTAVFKYQSQDQEPQ